MHNNHSKEFSSFYVTNTEKMARNNTNYRTTIWTGCHLQMTVMNIPTCTDIGLEIHKEHDQIINIMCGTGMLQMGYTRNNLSYEQTVYAGDTVFVPAGTWHNITNISNTPLKLSTIYGPPHHPAGTIHRTKADSEKADY